MRKAMQVCAVAGGIMLCFSFMIANIGGAEERQAGNTVQDGQFLAAVMPDTASGLSTQSNALVEHSHPATNEDPLILVAPKEKKCDPGAPCTTRSPAGQTAIDGTACTSGVACMFSGVQFCNMNTGTCTTVHVGNPQGKCACSCIPN